MNKDKLIKVRVTKDEKKSLATIVEELNLKTESEYIRMRLFDDQKLRSVICDTIEKNIDNSSKIQMFQIEQLLPTTWSTLSPDYRITIFTEVNGKINMVSTYPFRSSTDVKR